MGNVPFILDQDGQPYRGLRRQGYIDLPAEGLTADIRKKLYSGRNVPTAPIKSRQSMEFWRSQADYLVNGFHHRGTYITKFHYYYLNFCWYEMLDAKDNKVFFQPYYTQEDDKVFKCIEEAKDDSLAFMLMTARGWGKSTLISSIADYHYTLIRNSSCIISASYDDPATTLYEFISKSLNEKPKFLYHNRLFTTADEYIESGYKRTVEGKEKIYGYRSRIDKIIFDNNAGATRGFRPDVQVFEEIGNWKGSAGLIDCYSQSVGSFKRGGYMSAMVLMTGTGGNMASGASKDAKIMFNDPRTFNIYPLELNGKKTAYFIPGYKKRWKFYDLLTGVNDEVGAKADMDRELEEAKGNPQLFQQLTQEFPKTVIEMFMTKGNNIFPQDKIAHQRMKIGLNVDNKEWNHPMRGDLFWKKDNMGKITGVEWVDNPTGGPIWCYEKPQTDHEGVGYRNLYIAGIDSIDQGTGESIGETGSAFSMSVKKRFLNIQSTANKYVCFYTDRPQTAYEAFDRALKISWWYNCRINVEFSKIAIVSYFKERKQYWRFIERPAIAQSDKLNGSQNSTLIGTQMTVSIKGHLQIRLQHYLNEYCDILNHLEALEQLQDYTPENQGDYDIVVSMGLCEIADEDMFEVIPTPQQPKRMLSQNGYGYYIDERGYKQYGIIPDYAVARKELAPARERHVSYIDIENQRVEYS